MWYIRSTEYYRTCSHVPQLEYRDGICWLQRDPWSLHGDTSSPGRHQKDPQDLPLLYGRHSHVSTDHKPMPTPHAVHACPYPNAVQVCPYPTPLPQTYAHTPCPNHKPMPSPQTHAHTPCPHHKPMPIPHLVHACPYPMPFKYAYTSCPYQKPMPILHAVYRCP